MPASIHSSLALSAFVELADGIPGVDACAKDLEGRYVYANRAFAMRAGGRQVAEVIGKRAEDFFHPEVAESVRLQDEAVLATGRPLQHEMEAVIASDGSAAWVITSKARLLADDGSKLGILALSVAVAGLRPETDAMHRSLAAILGEVRTNPAEPWRAGDLCQALGLSHAQVERLTDRLLGLSPTQLVLRARVEAAMHELSHGNESLATVAAKCGFYDQSSFTKQFRTATGVTPGTYRTMHPMRAPRS